MKNLEDYEYINRFFEFDLSEEELAEFERRLQEDPEFARRVDLFREMEDHISESLPAGTAATGHTAVDEYELINRFFYYELDQDELTTFENSVEGNPQLKGRIAGYLEMQEQLAQTIHSDQEVQQQKEAFQQGLKTTSSSGGRVTSMRPTRLLIGIAATLLLLIVAWLVIPGGNGLTNEELAMQYWDNSAKITFGELRSESDRTDGETALLEASRLFDEGQFQGSLDQLGAIATGDSLYLNAFLLRGEAQMALGDYQTAIDNFQSVLDAPDGKFRDAALWFQALAYLQLGEVDSAGSNLSEIVNEGYPLAGKARELAAELEE